MKNREVLAAVLGEILLLGLIWYGFRWSTPWLMQGGWGKVIAYFILSPWGIGISVASFQLLYSSLKKSNPWIRIGGILAAIGLGSAEIILPWKFTGSYSVSVWIMGILISLNALAVIGGVIYVFYPQTPNS